MPERVHGRFASVTSTTIARTLAPARTTACAGVLACVACGSARAAGVPSLDALGPHTGWMLLAGVGLVAVVVGVLTVGRPRRARRALMDATTVLREEEPLREEADPAAPAAGTTASGLAQETTANDAIASPPEPPAVPSPTPQAQEAAGSSRPVLALHHVDVSIDVLRRHLEKELRPMPAVWLMLLDLARTHGREQTFGELALEFHRRFNARTPAWDGYPPHRDDPGLEAYPRLVKEITLAWGTHECCRLLDRLLYDTRGGDRKGFTLNAYNDLVALRRAADAVIDTLEQDHAEEAKLRSAFASASADAEPLDATPDTRSPLVGELESELERDLGHAPVSALEGEHPALARMLAREWGNAALGARLGEMLARGGDGAHRLSPEAAAELETLRAMAQRLATANGIPVPGEHPEGERSADSPADPERRKS